MKSTAKSKGKADVAYHQGAECTTCSQKRLNELSKMNIYCAVNVKALQHSMGAASAVGSGWSAVSEVKVTRRETRVAVRNSGTHAIRTVASHCVLLSTRFVPATLRHLAYDCRVGSMEGV